MLTPSLAGGKEVPVVDSSIAQYRLALDRLQNVSRALADYLENSEREDYAVAIGARLDEIWATYERTLVECQHAFRHVPTNLRATVPPLPRV